MLRWYRTSRYEPGVDDNENKNVGLLEVNCCLQPLEITPTLLIGLQYAVYSVVATTGDMMEFFIYNNIFDLPPEDSPDDRCIDRLNKRYKKIYVRIRLVRPESDQQCLRSKNPGANSKGAQKIKIVLNIMRQQQHLSSYFNYHEKLCARISKFILIFYKLNVKFIFPY